MVEPKRNLRAVFPRNLKIALLTTYFSIIFFAKKFQIGLFSNFFVNSKFDILKVIPKKIPILWKIRGGLSFTIAYGESVVEPKGISKKVFQQNLKNALFSASSNFSNQLECYLSKHRPPKGPDSPLAGKRLQSSSYNLPLNIQKFSQGLRRENVVIEINLMIW